MGFPDRIERVVDLDQPPAVVWEALTTVEGLRAWFSDEVTLDLQPGGAARMTWHREHAPVMRVERVEPHRVFAFTWPIEANGVDATPRTYVEFTLEPREGGTRLTIVESGFAQLPPETFDPTLEGHLEGWERELAELVAHLGS